MSDARILENDEDRVMRVRIPLRSLMRLLYQTSNPPGYVELYDHSLPEGFKVRSIVPASGGLSFEVLVEHPSFANVPPGEIPPVWPDLLNIKVYQIKKD